MQAKYAATLIDAFESARNYSFLLAFLFAAYAIVCGHYFPFPD